MIDLIARRHNAAARHERAAAIAATCPWPAVADLWLREATLAAALRDALTARAAAASGTLAMRENAP